MIQPRTRRMKLNTVGRLRKNPNSPNNNKLILSRHIPTTTEPKMFRNAPIILSFIHYAVSSFHQRSISIQYPSSVTTTNIGSKRRTPTIIVAGIIDTPMRVKHATAMLANDDMIGSAVLNMLSKLVSNGCDESMLLSVIGFTVDAVVESERLIGASCTRTNP